MPRWLKFIAANLIFFLVLVSIAGVAGYYWYQSSKFINTNDARVSANIVNVSAPSTGVLDEWKVKPGDTVSSGDILGVINPPDRPATGSLINKKIIPTQTTLPVPGGPAAPAPVQPQPAERKVQVKALTGGTVLQTSVQNGQPVLPGQPLAIISDLNKLSITANIEETKIDDVKINNDVDILLDAFPGESFKGKVFAINKVSTSTLSILPTAPQGGSFTKVVQKFPVIINIDEKGYNILPGMNAAVKIHKD